MGDALRSERGSPGASGVGRIGGYTLISASVTATALVVAGIWSLLASPGDRGKPLVWTVIAGSMLIVFLSCRVSWSVNKNCVVARQMIFRRRYFAADIAAVSQRKDCRWKQGVGYRWAPGEWAMVCGSRDVVVLTLKDGLVFSFSADDSQKFVDAFAQLQREGLAGPD